MSYSQFALIYDSLMENVPYEKWLTLIKETKEKYHVSGNKVLDVACGTGELSLKMLESGFEVSGLDLSEEMLAIANDKMTANKFRMPLFHQDMTAIEDIGLFDIVVLFLDSLNYLENAMDVKKTFDAIHHSLDDHGVFLFDVHSIYKMEHIFKNHTFAESGEEVSFIWDSFEGEFPHSVEHELSFFVKTAENTYQRFDEFHQQRTFPVEQYVQLLHEANFNVEEVLYDFSHAPSDKAERVFFVCKKK